MAPRDQFDSIAPIDYRYWDEELAPYLSENGFTRYKLKVQLALVRELARRDICFEDVVRQVEEAIEHVTTDEVYEEEQRIRHDIRALVNCIRENVSERAKPYVHLTATSYDIVDTANAARYKDAVEQVLVPALLALEGVLIDITLREAESTQVGRTHGQHAVPITFGYAMAGYVNRLGEAIEIMKERAGALCGKFSGAVGAYNASSLIVDDPETFEANILAELGLKPAEHSTQIAPPEALVRLLSEITIAMGVLANLADDMRHLQRTEIGEVGEPFDTNQVGSSTMPQKRNPINFENAKSCWKIIMARMTTVFMDQISEHQRDLTNSASGRTYGEIIAYAVSMTKRMTRTMRRLTVDRSNLSRNVMMQNGMIVAEPLQIILSTLGHPDAHEKVRQLTLQAQKEEMSFTETYLNDLEIQPYRSRMSEKQKTALFVPDQYTGIAPEKAKAIANRWKDTLDL